MKRPISLARRRTLRRLIKNATPGPWRCGGETDGEPGVMAGEWIAARPVLGPDRPVVWALWVRNDDALYFGFAREADRRLIQAARSVIPALLDALDAAEERAAAAEQRLATMQGEECHS